MRQIAEFIAVLSCALFTGAAVYITFIEHPARMQCGVEVAATEFAPSYRRATVMQAICAAVGLLSSLAAWLTGATFWWLVAGVLLGNVIPFTLIVILPTNKRLLDPTLDKRSAKAERLLARWGRLHAVRSMLSGLALLLFLYLAVFRAGNAFSTSAPRTTNDESELKHEIERIQNSLLPAAFVKGDPIRKMSLADQMFVHHATGVSIAIIHKGAI